MTKRTGDPVLMCKPCGQIILAAPTWIDIRSYSPVRGHETTSYPACNECGDRIRQDLQSSDERAESLAR